MLFLFASQVGYGKTAITLGLIDLANKLHATPATPAFFSSGWIATNATLVIVPKHMMGQWPNEVKKFLGTSKRVSAIKDLLALNKITIAEIQRADIVIVSFALLSNATYFARLTRLSGLNESSAPDVKRGGRHFSFAYGSCIKTALPSRVEEIQNDTANAFNNMALDVANSEKTDCIDILRVDGKAAAYKEGKSSVQARKIASQEKASEKDPWGLSASQVKKDFSKMTCPPLEMFFWNRLVVDEYVSIVAVL